MAQDIFLKINGIDGESADAAHKNEIEVLDWSWQIAQESTMHTGSGGGAGTPAAKSRSGAPTSQAQAVYGASPTQAATRMPMPRRMTSPGNSSKSDCSRKPSTANARQEKATSAVLPPATASTSPATPTNPPTPNT